VIGKEISFFGIFVKPKFLFLWEVKFPFLEVCVTSRDKVPMSQN